MAELQRGVVKWFNDAKGFGFIEHDSGKDIFVHYSVIQNDGYKTLKDGEEVEYALNEGDKGLNASKVIRVNVPVAAAADAELSSDAASNEHDLTGGATPNLQHGSINTRTQSLAESVEVQASANTINAARSLRVDEIAETIEH